MSETDPERHLDQLLEYLRTSRGLDLSSYKRGSIVRRLLKRMHDVHLDDFAEYVEFLEVHPDEFAKLFDTILINVTSFFRDPAAWEYVAQEVIPSLLAGKPAPASIRVWSAGCASGEEPYTAAIVLHEALGDEAFRQRVKIYATDIDENALNRARQGSYTAREVELLSSPRRERYFQLAGGRYVFKPDLRRAIIFGRHDLLQDAPISRLDLLVCRNTLMYFTAEAQNTILERLHFALGEHGALFLGKAEMLLTHGDLFKPIDLKHRVFVKVSTGGAPEHVVPPPPPDFAPRPVAVRLREVAFETAPTAQLIINPDGILALANRQARRLFALGLTDIGRPFHDLEVSYRPAELRSIIEQAVREGRSVTLDNIEHQDARGFHNLDVHVTPVADADTGALGVSIVFDDITQSIKLREELRRTSSELESAHQALQSSNEELETTNEELQSSNEELETTNEELQSSNEELETMNEELQSSNEELQTLNDELRQRSDDLNQINAFLDSILTGVRAAVIVVDEQLNVDLWNRTAEDLWGMRADEVKGKPLLDLDIGLPMDKLKPLIGACSDGGGARTRGVFTATNRRGRSIRCSAAVTPRLGPDRRRCGVILLIEELGGPPQGDDQ